MGEGPIVSPCSICRTQPSKYRCPRCTTVRTCSLPCYKKHQQRASCTGQRIATNYLKKSQVTTSQTLDHDYNFITGIERALSKGIDGDQGVNGDEPAPRRRNHGSNPAFERYLVEHNIRLERLPAGMQRARMNESRMLPKQKKVCWTVEWVGDIGEKQIGEAMEDVTVGQAWVEHQARQTKRKRKRGPDGTATGVEESMPTGAAAVIDVKGVATASGDTSTKSSAESYDHEAQELVSGSQVADETESSTQHVDDPAERSPAAATTTYYYLLRPHTSTKDKVLIPLDESRTMTSLLAGKTLIEFPTIYHLPCSPDAVPDGFVTETDYLTWLRVERPSAVSRAADVGSTAPEEREDGEADDDDATPSVNSTGLSNVTTRDDDFQHRFDARRDTHRGDFHNRGSRGRGRGDGGGRSSFRGRGRGRGRGGDSWRGGRGHDFGGKRGGRGGSQADTSHRYSHGLDDSNERGVDKEADRKRILDLLRRDVAT